MFKDGVYTVLYTAAGSLTFFCMSPAMLLSPSPVTLTPVIDTGGGMMWLCRHAAPTVCVRVCVHEGVRLIEVVRVKMIPWGGGRHSRWRREVGGISSG